MKSKTSLFNPALFRKNLTRFAPLWGLFLVLTILFGPVSILNNRASDFSELYGIHQSVLESYFEARCYTAVFYSFFYAPLCAGLLFRYLHHTRSAYMMHAYPLNRSTQFVTNILSGFCFAVVPFVLQFVLNLLAAGGLPEQSYLWKLLLVEILCFTFFFGLAVFCMHLSGNSIISVLSYFVLNFLFYAVPALMISLINTVSYGFDFSALDSKLLYLAPVMRMLSLQFFLDSTATIEWTAFLVYGLIGCVLLAVSWLLYRRRHLEQAGEAMVFPWARHAFLALFTIFCTLGLGMLLTDLFVGSAGSWRETLPSTLLFFLLASFVGWFGAQMMLKRTVRVFRKRTVLGWACIAAAMAALICGLRFDVPGTQRYVPTQEELQSVTLTLDTNNYSDRNDLDAVLSVTDPEILAAVRAAHQDAYSFYCDNGRRNGFDLTIRYHLRSGRTVKRKITISENTLQQFSMLLDQPEYATQYYEDILPEALRGKKHFILEYYDPDSNRYNNNIVLSGTDNDTLPDLLQEAMLRDAAEGNLPIPFLETVHTFDWDLTATDGPNYNEFSGLVIPSTAKHTLKLFGAEP